MLVSLDGFRWDYLDRPNAVNLRRLAAQGVRAERMMPSFPSLTFPNHYAIVTGMYPEHNGIVDNTMFDATLGWFKMSDTVAVHTEAWWTGEPIWATAERQGVHAGAFFWPGSEVAHNGVWPSRFMKFNDKFSRAARIDSVLTWLTLPAPATMSFVAVYYSDVDHAGHDFGPASPQVDSAIARVDSQVGRLMDGIAARGLSDRVNIIVVADHGMTPTPPSQVIFVDDYISLDDIDVVDLAEVGLITPKSGKLEDVYRRLHGANPHMNVYRKVDVPARFHFDDNPRITPLVLMPEVGWTLTTRSAAVCDAQAEAPAGTATTTSRHWKWVHCSWLRALRFVRGSPCRRSRTFMSTTSCAGFSASRRRRMTAPPTQRRRCCGRSYLQNNSATG